jgi:group II intron reverse transcriptase/maturase
MMCETSSGLIEIASESSLQNAWQRVALKHGAAGIDHVTIEQFEQRLPEEIRQLGDEIVSGAYQPQPLVVFPKAKKEAGYREITVGAIRDRVAARSTADFLNRHLDPRLRPQSYAYRSGRGALRAVTATQEACRRATHVVRVDIRSFFDSVEHGRLNAQLQAAAVGPDVRDLALRFVRNPRFNGVAAVQPERGIPQGSPLAPVLSNLYLDPLDRALAAARYDFVRYADDLVAFAGDSVEASQMLSSICFELASLGLHPSTEKSRVYRVDEGFLFLGFLFNRTGHTASTEARERLRGKLSEKPYDDESPAAFERRRESVVRGWNNYFAAAATDAPAPNRPGVDPSVEPTIPCQTAEPDGLTGQQGVRTGPTDSDTPSSDPTHESAIPLPQNDEIQGTTTATDPDSVFQVQLRELREWTACGRQNEAAHGLRRLLNDDDATLSAASRQEALRLLADVYHAQGLRGAAAACLRQAGGEPAAPPPATEDTAFGARDVETWLALFAAGSGAVHSQYVDGTGRSGYRPFAAGLTPETLRDHWQGLHTLAVPVHDATQSVRFAVIDLDINRTELDRATAEELAVLREHLLDDARHLLDVAHRAGVEGLIERSGYKGYHVWFLLHQPISAALAVHFLHDLARVAGAPCPASHREFFPAAAAPSADGANARIKLPCGIHRLTGERSRFLGPDGSPCRMQIQTLGMLSLRNTAGGLRRALDQWIRSAPEPADSPTAAQTDAGQHGAETPVSTLMQRCAVLGALARKARETKDLSHYERLIVRGVLDPLGPAGHQAIHDILGSCSNYNRRVTDGFLGRPGIKPMGCTRIREILGTFCAEVGCDCRFAPRKTDYAHPLRHLHPSESASARPRSQPASAPNPQPEAPTPTTPHASAAASTPTAPRKASKTTPAPAPESADPAAAAAGIRQVLNEYSRLRTELLHVQERIEAAIGPKGSLALDLGTLTSELTDPDLRRWIIRL